MTFSPPKPTGTPGVEKQEQNKSEFHAELLPGCLERVSTSGVAVGSGLLQLLTTCIPSELLDIIGDDLLFNGICTGALVNKDDKIDTRELKALTALAEHHQKQLRSQ